MPQMYGLRSTFCTSSVSRLFFSSSTSTPALFFCGTAHEQGHSAPRNPLHEVIRVAGIPGCSNQEAAPA